jgi:hypothetical protein
MFEHRCHILTCDNQCQTWYFISFLPPGLLPIKWRLAGVEGLPKELSVSPVSGELQARSSIKVAVEFAAFEKRDVTGVWNNQV